MQARRLLGMVLMLAAFSIFLAACGASEPTQAPTATSAPATTGPGPTTAPTATSEPSFDAEAYFKGKTLRLVTEGNPGGGTDTQARLFARFWADFIPGKPRVVVSNLRPPVAAMNLVWNSKPNGLTIYFSSTNRTPDDREPQAEFRTDQFLYLGAHGRGISGWGATDGVPHKTIAEARNQPGTTMTMAIEAKRAEDLVPGSEFNALLLKDWLNLPLKILTVPEIGATSTALLMVERKEINIVHMANQWFQLPQLRPGWVTEGKIRPFATLGPASSFGPNAEGPWDAPHVTEFLTEEQKAIWETLNDSQDFYQKGLMTTPGTPDDVLKALRESYVKLVTDPEFSEVFAKATGLPPSLLEGAEMQDLAVRYHDSLDSAASEFAKLQTELWNKHMR